MNSSAVLSSSQSARPFASSNAPVSASTSNNAPLSNSLTSRANDLLHTLSTVDDCDGGIFSQSSQRTATVLNKEQVAKDFQKSREILALRNALRKRKRPLDPSNADENVDTPVENRNGSDQIKISGSWTPDQLQYLSPSADITLLATGLPELVSRDPSGDPARYKNDALEAFNALERHWLAFSPEQFRIVLGKSNSRSLKFSHRLFGLDMNDCPNISLIEAKYAFHISLVFRVYEVLITAGIFEISRKTSDENNELNTEEAVEPGQISLASKTYQQIPKRIKLWHTTPSDLEPGGAPGGLSCLKIDYKFKKIIELIYLTRELVFAYGRSTTLIWHNKGRIASGFEFDSIRFSNLDIAKPSTFQILVSAIGMHFYLQEFRTIGDYLYQQCMIPSEKHHGTVYPSHFYERKTLISTEIDHFCNPDSQPVRYSMYMSLKPNVLLEYFRNCKDWHLPTVVRHPRLFTLRNGLLLLGDEEFTGVGGRTCSVIPNGFHARFYLFEPSDDDSEFNAKLINSSYCSSRFFDIELDKATIESINAKDVPLVDFLLSRSVIEVETDGIGGGDQIVCPTTWPTPVFDSIFAKQGYSFFKPESIADDATGPPELSSMYQIYALIGRLLYDVNELDNFQLALFLLGVAGSGKSLICDVISSMFADEVVGKLSSNCQQTFSLSAYVDSRIIICTEVKDTFALSMAEFQCMVSGEPMTVNRKNNEVVKVPAWKAPMFMVGNQLPNWHDAMGALHRRIVVTNFDKAVTATEVDIDLFKKVQSEIPLLIIKFHACYIHMLLENGKKSWWSFADPVFHKARQEAASGLSPLKNFILSADYVTSDPLDERKAGIFTSFMSYDRLISLFVSWCRCQHVGLEYTNQTQNNFNVLKELNFHVQFATLSEIVGSAEVETRFVFGIRGDDTPCQQIIPPGTIVMDTGSVDIGIPTDIVPVHDLPLGSPQIINTGLGLGSGLKPVFFNLSSLLELPPAYVIMLEKMQTYLYLPEISRHDAENLFSTFTGFWLSNRRVHPVKKMCVSLKIIFKLFGIPYSSFPQRDVVDMVYGFHHDTTDMMFKVLAKSGLNFSNISLGREGSDGGDGGDGGASDTDIGSVSCDAMLQLQKVRECLFFFREMIFNSLHFKAIACDYQKAPEPVNCFNLFRFTNKTMCDKLPALDQLIFALERHFYHSKFYLTTNDRVCCELMIPATDGSSNAFHTHSWIPHTTLGAEINRFCNSKLNGVAWKNLTTNYKVFRAKIEESFRRDVHSSLPTVKRHPRLFSFRNGLLLLGMELMDQTSGKMVGVLPPIGTSLARFFHFENAPEEKFDAKIIPPDVCASRHFDYELAWSVIVSVNDENSTQCPFDLYDVQKLWATPVFDSIFQFQGYSFYSSADSPENIDLDQLVIQRSHTPSGYLSSLFQIYALIGRLLYRVNELDNYQIAPFINGVAGTGKSIVCDTVSKFFGEDMVGRLSSNCQQTFALSAFVDSHVVICSEVKSNFSISRSDLQSMITGESISVNVKHKEVIQVSHWSSQTFLVGNEYPAWHDAQGALHRRWAVVKFPNSVCDSSVDTTLSTQIDAEIPLLLIKLHACYIKMVRMYDGMSFWNFCHKSFHIARGVAMLQLSAFKNFLENCNDLIRDRLEDRVGDVYTLYLPYSKMIAKFTAWCKTQNILVERSNQYKTNRRILEDLNFKVFRMNLPTAPGAPLRDREFIFGITEASAELRSPCPIDFSVS